jgi:hypothetical protein
MPHDGFSAGKIISRQTTPADSPFRRFTVSCLKCGSFKLQVIGEFDSDAGELKIFLFCPSCRAREQLPVRQGKS